jgi:hypothetical protein
MKFVLFLGIGLASAVLAQNAPTDSDAELNVNSRYTVESIDFSNAGHYRLSNSLVDDMQRLIGHKLDSLALNRLTSRIRDELRAHTVTFRLARGGEPNSVRVLLQVDRQHRPFDIAVPKFAYESKQGLSGVAELGTNVGESKFTFSVVSDGDTLIERFTGIQAKYERLAVGTDRIRFGFEFDDYHELYNNSTLRAIANASGPGEASSLGAGAYRSRMNFEPSATFVIAKPLTWTVGLSFEEMQPQVTAARTESANALENTLRFHRSWEDSDIDSQDLDAGYSLRAATHSLGSDLAYTRQLIDIRYRIRRGRQLVEASAMAGVISGDAPLFDRFVLGDSATLRGWNKYDLDPVGGNRMLYGSVTYGYRLMRLFYDAGSVWNKGQGTNVKQSVGVGLTSGLGIFQRDAFLLAMAFPLREGRAEPVLIAGMNF